MIAKVGSSTNITATINYLENEEDRVAWKEPKNLASTDQEFVKNEMKEVAKNSRTDEPIYHYSISWDESDNPSREQMSQAANQTIKDLGLEEHQALIMAHNDHAYQHLHVMVNRVHPVKGTAWNKYRDYIKLEKSLRSLERNYGWKEVPGHHHQLEDQREPEYGKSLNKFECGQIKEGDTPLYMLIREQAAHDFRDAQSWEELHQRLAEKGLTIQRGSRGTGGKVTDGYEFANLSKVHRDFSMGRLEKRLGPFRSLQELRKGQALSGPQKSFVRFERAVRLNKSGQGALKKALRSSLQAAGTAKKIHSSLNSLLAISSPGNPALKIAKGLGKQLIKQLKYQQTRGRGL
jgi:hypothetical protein